jgi:hypothetical protein
VNHVVGELDEGALQRLVLLDGREVAATAKHDHATDAVEVVADQVIPPTPRGSLIARVAGGEETAEVVLVMTGHR